MHYRIVLFAIILTGLSACNTMQGLGQDIEAAGYSLRQAADRNRDAFQSEPANPQPLIKQNRENTQSDHSVRYRMPAPVDPVETD